jgi:hypothetical protein
VIDAMIAGVRALGAGSGGTHAFFRIRGSSRSPSGIAFLYDPDAPQSGAVLAPVSSGEHVRDRNRAGGHERAGLTWET